MTLEAFVARGRLRQQEIDAIIAKHNKDQLAAGYYIATVWTANGTFGGAMTRQVIRLWACGPADYQTRVQQLWPTRALTFGPVSRSKMQTAT